MHDFLDQQIFSTSKIDLTISDILVIILFFIGTKFVLKLVKMFFKRLESLKKIERGSAMSYFTLVSYAVWIFVITIVLKLLEVNINVLIASSAALFVGIGLGLQQLFNDFASGIIMLFERTIKIGDVVELDDGTVGRIVKIKLRVSKIMDRNNISIIVPNSMLVNDRVINWSLSERKTRFSVKVGVEYGSNVELVTKLLTEACKGNPHIEQTPSPFTQFSDFGDSALNFKIFFWTSETFLVESTKSDLRIKIDSLFRENNIIIAFPQLDVHVVK